MLRSSARNLGNCCFRTGKGKRSHGSGLSYWFLTQVIYRLFVNVSSANLINLITNKNDIPEYLFYNCNYKNLYSEAEKILVNKKQAETQLISSKQAIRELGYGTKDPSVRAAKSIKDYFKLQ